MLEYMIYGACIACLSWSYHEIMTGGILKPFYTALERFNQYLSSNPSNGHPALLYKPYAWLTTSLRECPYCLSGQIALAYVITETTYTGLIDIWKAILFIGVSIAFTGTIYKLNERK